MASAFHGLQDVDNELMKQDAEIEKLTFAAAAKKLKEHNIDLKGKTKKHELRRELKLRLLCKTTRKEYEQKFISNMMSEARCKDDLCKLFGDVINYTKEIIKTTYPEDTDDPSVDDLIKWLPNLLTKLHHEREKVAHGIVPILVLGETGSGKTSFINLLLGEKLLPTSVLSNTHVICEIRHSNLALYKAIFHSIDGTIQEMEYSTSAEFTRKISADVQATDDNNKPIYKKVELLLPVDILQGGMMIVDSPGIGENSSMDSAVMEYVEDAAAFIYVVDITNAGGVQERMQKFIANVSEKAQLQELQIRSDIALFICNKWDEVPEKETGTVIDDTREKIKNIWSNCKDDQIIPFSTKEAQTIQDDDGLVAPKYQFVLNKITRLIPEAHVMSILRGSNFLIGYLKRSQFVMKARLSNLQMGEEKRMQNSKQIKAKLNKIESSLDAFFKGLRNEIDVDIRKRTESLKAHLTCSDTREAICRITEQDLPKETHPHKASVEVRLKLYENMRKHIKKWKTENMDQALLRSIQTAIDNEFPIFRSALGNLENELLSRPGENTSTLPLRDDTPSIISDFLQTFDEMPFLKKVLVFPLLPGLLVVDELYTRFKQKLNEIKPMSGDYKKAKCDTNKAVICTLYAEKVFNQITDKVALEDLIKEDLKFHSDLLDNQECKMKSHIEDDRRLLKQLEADSRNADTVKQLYEPLQNKIEIMSRHLCYFLTMHFPNLATDLPCVAANNVKVTSTVICSGFEAEIRLDEGKCVLPDRSTDQTEAQKHRQICVRIQKKRVEVADIETYMAILQEYREANHKSIARCLGFTTASIHDGGRLYQLLQPLQGSLRRHLSLLWETPDFINNEFNNYFGMIHQVVCGVEFLHHEKRNLVHFDLSLETVGVDFAGNLKLTNLCKESEVTIELPKSGVIRVADFVHLCPRLLTPTVSVDNSKASATRSKREDAVVYTKRDDLYSVGIMMLYMAKGKTFAQQCGDFTVCLQSTRQEDVFGSELEETLEATTKLEAESRLEARQRLLVMMDRVLPPKDVETLDDTVDIKGMWWRLVGKCLKWKEEPLTARDWLMVWSDYRH